jgi:hypothetical protein
MNPLWAALLGGVAGFIGSAVFAIFLTGIAMRDRDSEQLGFITGMLVVSNILLVVTNTLLGGILGVLLFQAMR